MNLRNQKMKKELIESKRKKINLEYQNLKNKTLKFSPERGSGTMMWKTLVCEEEYCFGLTSQLLSQTT